MFILIIIRTHFIKYVKTIRWRQGLLAASLFKKFLQEFDVFIGHICYSVGVGAIEVNETEFWNYFRGLGLDGLEVALAEPAVDGVIGITCGGDDLWDSECIGDGFKFLFEPRAEV